MFNWNSVIAPFCVLALVARGYRLRGLVNFLVGDRDRDDVPGRNILENGPPIRTGAGTSVA